MLKENREEAERNNWEIKKKRGSARIWAVGEPHPHPLFTCPKPPATPCPPGLTPIKPPSVLDGNRAIDQEAAEHRRLVDTSGITQINLDLKIKDISSKLPPVLVLSFEGIIVLLH